MLSGTTARTSARLLALSSIAATLVLAPAPPASAAITTTQPDQVGMVDGRVRAIEVVGNRIWVGGTFSHVRDGNGTNVGDVSGLAVFDADTGAPVTSIQPPSVIKSSGPGTVFDLSLGPDGLLYLAGSFDRVGGAARKNVAAIDPADGSVEGFAPNTASAKSVLASSGAIYVGTSKLLSFQRSGSPTPGFDPPQVETDPSLRGHVTQPQVRDLVPVGSMLLAACQCDSTVDGTGSRPAKAVIKVDAASGSVQDWSPGGLGANGAAFGISLLVENDPGTGRPTVYLGAGGSDFVGAYDVATGNQVFKTDTSGSAQAVAWMDGVLFVGGHFQWVARTSSQHCDDNAHPNTACHHAPRLVSIDPDTGLLLPESDPWNPGICCRYNGVWALTPDASRQRLHVGGEFTKVGGTWSGSDITWQLTGARTQAYYARFSGTPTTLRMLTISLAGDGSGRVSSMPSAADCSTSCTVGFVDGTSVTLTAAADPGSTFVGWSGACGGSVGCSVTMDRERSVTATFAADTTTATCGRIAFTSSRAGNLDISTMSRQGTQRVRITSHAAADRDPAWSPDCSRIAFSSLRASDAEIFVMDADGSDLVRLTHAPGADTLPAWSPDGDRIAFTSTRTGDAEVFVMDADGGGVTNLTTDPARDRAPAWSPDGRRIAFDSDRGGATNVWTMSPSGAGVRNLTGDTGRSTSPAYSPGGETIAFSSDRGGSRRIWLMDADGLHPRRITKGAGSHTQPAWAPNGKRIAFASTRTGRTQLWLVKRIGSTPRLLSTSRWVEFAPDWA
jgi:Tol biopolymer transport system component